MLDRWNPPSAASEPPLADCVRAARCVGAEPELAIAGGGNTSVKIDGDAGTILWVKGSGTDLARVSADDYAPLDLAAIEKLLCDPALDNTRMRDALRTALRAPAAPRPSIETLMHAALPWPHVIHTHAAPILALCNTAQAEAIVSAALGRNVLQVPYRHSGASLAAACREALARYADAQPAGLVLMRHGLVTWGGTAREAYAATLALCARADAYLDARGATRPAAGDLVDAEPDAAARNLVEQLRADAAEIAGRPLAGVVRNSRFMRDFAGRRDVAAITAQGPSTPGHTLLTRAWPQVGRDCAAYASAYREHLCGIGDFDHAPRVILDPAFGALILGVDAAHAEAAATVFVNDAIVMARAAAIDRYRGPGAAWLRLAEVEYSGAAPEAIARAAALAGATETAQA
ncbi:MAG: class II aldolase/adducin family protein [Burkholderiales bacterium]|nr:class II aldolase/adducin family protein [Burkholderiales bacterium]